MKKRIPKLDEDGIAILCQLCHGDGCYRCDFEGVELTDNDEYIEQQIDQHIDEGVW